MTSESIVSHERDWYTSRWWRPCCRGRSVCISVEGWRAEQSGAEILYNLQAQNLLNHHRKVIRNLAEEQGADCQERTQKPHFLSTIPVMNWKGWGGAEKQISCGNSSLFSAWFATVLQCVRIYIHVFVNHSLAQ